MFRPLYAHHQAYHVIKTLRTLLGSQLCLQNLEMTSRLRIYVQSFSKSFYLYVNSQA